MIKTVLYTSSLIMLLGCGEEKKEVFTQKAKQEKKDSIITKLEGNQPIEEFVSLTNENVEKRLLAYGKENPETEVDIYTSKGKIRVKLFEDTPLHRANFIMMAKKGYYRKSVFTRVVKGFMAQAGGTYTDDHKWLKQEIGKYTIPSEIKQHHYHKKGAVGAARLYINNDEKRSAPYAFYFVEGTKYSNKALKHYEEENNYTYSDEQKEYYSKDIGAAHIDGEHTVFGQIIDGYEVVPKLTSVKKDTRDWPLTDLFIDSVVVIK